MIRKILSKLLAKPPPEPFADLLKLRNMVGANRSGEKLTIFDIGAYKGGVSVRLSQLFPRSDIYAFEPVSSSFNALRSRTASLANIHCFNVALGEKDEGASINVNSFGETSSLFASNKTNTFIDNLTSTISREAVSVISLDSFASVHQIKAIDLLKIDVQGYELHVLKGARTFLESGNIRYIFCEAEFIEIYKGQPLIDGIISFLRNYGYIPVDIVNLNYTQDGRLAWCDIIFCNEDSLNKFPVMQAL